MRTIGLLLGIPEADQEGVRDRIDQSLRLDESTMPDPTSLASAGSADDYGAYIDWRIDHPSDDLMTELLTAEFTDEHGSVRTLTRDEILGYIGLLSGAGNETTTRLIGWAGKLLAEWPDQRRSLSTTRPLSPAPSRSSSATSRRHPSRPARSCAMSTSTARSFQPEAPCCC